MSAREAREFGSRSNDITTLIQCIKMEISNMMKAPVLITIVTSALSLAVLAQPPNGGGGGGRRGPPPEAISACNGQSEGASCSFTGPPGAISGTCRRVPEGSFACVPTNPPPRGNGGQPPPNGGMNRAR